MSLNGGRSAIGPLRTLDDIAPFAPTHEAIFRVTGRHGCPVLVDASERHPRNATIRVQSMADGAGVQWIDSRKLECWRAIR